MLSQRMVNKLKMDKLKDLTAKELGEKMMELKNELFNLRFQLVGGQLDNPMRIKAVKRDIARVKTLIREKELS